MKYNHFFNSPILAWPLCLKAILQHLMLAHHQLYQDIDHLGTAPTAVKSHISQVNNVGLTQYFKMSTG
jgi:hypothetical protein